eukprot:196555-Amphidinium_carterae.2
MRPRIQCFSYWPKGGKQDLLTPEGVAKMHKYRQGHKRAATNNTYQVLPQTVEYEADPHRHQRRATEEQDACTELDNNRLVESVRHLDKKPELPPIDFHADFESTFAYAE